MIDAYYKLITALFCSIFLSILFCSVDTSALSVSWPSTGVDFANKPGLNTATHTQTSSIYISGATYGFTASVGGDTCLRHEAIFNQQPTPADCAGTPATYKIAITRTISPTNSSSSSATATLAIKAAVTDSNIAGDYSGIVTVTILAKDPPPPPTYTIWGNMQNFTSTQCGQMSNYNTATGELLFNGTAGSSLSGKNTVYLTDNRNYQQYRIRKMQDGKCWMIDNLKIYGTTISSSNSDLASGSFTLPSSLNTTYSTVDYASRIDNPNSTAYCSSTVYSAFPSTTTGCGYLYNWFTATAGQGDATVTTAVTNSICPKNWNLPNGAVSGGSFFALGQGVSLVSGGGMSWQGVYAGVLSGSGFSNQGSYGSYWTDNAYKNNYRLAYSLQFGSGTVNYSNDYFKYEGYAVRCIL